MNPDDGSGRPPKRGRSPDGNERPRKRVHFDDSADRTNAAEEGRESRPEGDGGHEPASQEDQANGGAEEQPAAPTSPSQNPTSSQDTRPQRPYLMHPPPRWSSHYPGLYNTGLTDILREGLNRRTYTQYPPAIPPSLRYGDRYHEGLPGTQPSTHDTTGESERQTPPVGGRYSRFPSTWQELPVTPRYPMAPPTQSPPYPMLPLIRRSEPAVNRGAAETGHGSYIGESPFGTGPMYRSRYARPHREEPRFGADLPQDEDDTIPDVIPSTEPVPDDHRPSRIRVFPPIDPASLTVDGDHDGDHDVRPITAAWHFPGGQIRVVGGVDQQEIGGILSFAFPSHNLPRTIIYIYGPPAGYEGYSLQYRDPVTGTQRSSHYLTNTEPTVQEEPTVQQGRPRRRRADPPASEAAIAALPNREVTASEAGDRCGVCWEEKQPGDNVAVLPCNHWFEKECIEPWLRMHGNCPTCRAPIEEFEDSEGSVESENSEQSNESLRLEALQDELREVERERDLVLAHLMRLDKLIEARRLERHNSILGDSGNGDADGEENEGSEQSGSEQSGSEQSGSGGSEQSIESRGLEALEARSRLAWRKHDLLGEHWREIVDEIADTEERIWDRDNPPPSDSGLGAAEREIASGERRLGSPPTNLDHVDTNALPTRPLTSADADEDGSLNCFMCLEAASDSVTELPCGHWFDTNCIRSWLREQNTCPRCGRRFQVNRGDQTQ